MRQSIRYIYTYLVLLFASAVGDLFAQSTDSIRYNLDSLLSKTISSEAYYTPSSVVDSSLLALMYRREQSPLIEYLQVGDLGVKHQAPSLLAYKICLPLATKYGAVAEIAHKSEPLAVSIPTYTYAPNVISYQVSTLRFAPDLGLKLRLMNHTMFALQQQRIDLFHYGAEALGTREALGISNLNVNPQMLEQRFEQRSVKQLAEALQLQEIERRYWIPAFECSAQFSQNHVSDNWHKGGSSNLNLIMRSYASMIYLKKSINWKTELESKLSIYNTDKSEKDRVRSFRIADDLLRLRSNFGLKASKRWFYTLDTEARTQLLNNYKGNTNVLQSALLAPMTLNIGLGMKFDYSSKSTKVYRRKFAYSMNLAPISYTYRSTARRDIDLGRHGLSEQKPSFHRFGSTLRASMQWDINMNLTWQSRFYFNTSYANVETEWENTLDMKIGRYFSTRINVQLRFDDAVRPASGWNRYLQFNELISFGFNYRL
ncbi:MAG: DUF3078 domain-containing protein [Porphyromonadaceae bacterium]|nr:DUF3078 domain-containing protein [Porphyromonadaceae bacterium]